MVSLTPAALDGEIWRLWTGHLAHYTPAHLLVNVAAAALPLLLLPPSSRRLMFLRAIWVAPILSLVLLGIGGFDELRGLSGIAVFVWCGSGIMLIRARRLLEGCALLVAVGAKLLLERHLPAPFVGGGFEDSVAAHAAGALLAVATNVGWHQMACLIWHRHGERVRSKGETDGNDSGNAFTTDGEPAWRTTMAPMV